MEKLPSLPQAYPHFDKGLHLRAEGWYVKKHLKAPYCICEMDNLCIFSILLHKKQYTYKAALPRACLHHARENPGFWALHHRLGGVFKSASEQIFWVADEGISVPHISISANNAESISALSLEEATPKKSRYVIGKTRSSFKIFIKR